MDWAIMIGIYSIIILIASCRIEYRDCKCSKEGVDGDSSLFTYLWRLSV